MTITLPQIESCKGCGACCLHVGTPPGFAAWFPPPGRELAYTASFRRGNPDAKIVAKMPREAITSLQAGFAEAWETERSGQNVPCFWWDPTTRRCKHHEHRPNVCRDFKVGGEACVRLRDEYRIGAPR